MVGGTKPPPKERPFINEKGKTKFRLAEKRVQTGMVTGGWG